MDEVSLEEMLEARDRRALMQREMTARYGKPLLSFTMNIPGPEKNNNLIEYCFRQGGSAIREKCSEISADIVCETETNEKTGCELLLAIDADPIELKKAMMQIENLPYGRLFDIDIIKPDGTKISRCEIGFDDRKCLICGRNAAECARSRSHSIKELQKKTHELLCQTAENTEAMTIADHCCQALVMEVRTTPKPGLVDLRNNGSHSDMNIDTFMASINALGPYFRKCASAGIMSRINGRQPLLDDIREFGKEAEKAMFAATGGANTHKGSIFSLGIAAMAAGSLNAGERHNSQLILDKCAQISRGIVKKDLGKTNIKNARTNGERLYAEYGITGIRGQAEEGFPAVLYHGLPVLEGGIGKFGTDRAGTAALLSIICNCTDTNIVSRSSPEKNRQIQKKIKSILSASPYPDYETCCRLDDEFIKENISPGGSADLLALSFFLYMLKTCDNRPCFPVKGKGQGK